MNTIADKKASLVVVVTFSLALITGYLVQTGVMGIVLLILGSIFLGILALLLPVFYAASLAPGQKPNFKRRQPGNFYEWLRTRWLTERVGEPPLSYWRIFLWFCLAIGILGNLAEYFGIFTQAFVNIARESGSALRIGAYQLPLSAAVAGLVIIQLIKKAPVSRLIRPAFAISLALLAGALLFPVKALLDSLIRAVGINMIELLDVLVPNIFSLLSVVLILWIVAIQHPPVGVGLKVFLAGSIAGLALSLALAYPVLTWLYSYIPGASILGEDHERALLICAVSACLIGLSIGPGIVWAARPRNALQKAILGALAGSIAGGYVFGFLGGSASGLIAQATLLPIVVSREGFGGDTWVYKLALAVNNVFPWVMAATWLLIGGGLLIGMLSALLVPLPAIRRSKPPLPGWKHMLSELVWPGSWLLEILTFIVIVATFSLLADSIQNVFDNFGVTPQPSPTLNFEIMLSQHWVLILLLQVLGTMWIYQRFIPYNQQGGNKVILQAAKTTAYMLPVLGLLMIVFFFYIQPGLFFSPAFLFFALLSVVISIESILGLFQLQPRADEGPIERSIPQEASEEFPEKTDWHGASLPLGFFITILIMQFLMTSLSMVLVAVVLITQISDVTAQPKGIEWLNQQSVLPLIQVSSFSFMAMLLGCMAMSTSARDPFIRVSKHLDHTPVEETKPAKKKWLDFGPLKQAILNVLSRPRTKYILAILLTLIGFTWSLSPSIDRDAITLVFLTAAFLAIREEFVRRLRISAVLVAFLITFFSLVLSIDPDAPNDTWIHLLFSLGFAIGAAIAFRAILLYAPARRRLTVRRVILVGTSIAIVLISSTGQAQIRKSGGVSSFDQQSWTVYAQSSSLEESLIGGSLNYTLFRDSKDRLWYGSGTGAVALNDHGHWNVFILATTSAISTSRSAQSDPERLRAFFFEDDRLRVWVADGEIFGLLDPEYRNLTIEPDATGPAIPSARVALITPKNNKGESLNLESPVLNAAQAANGEFWLVTSDGSAMQLTPGAAVSSADWTIWTFEDRLLSVYADRQGRVWFSGLQGIYNFEDGNLNLLLPVESSFSNQTIFFEDSTGGFWIGTNTGGYYRQQDQFIPLQELDGWPGETAATAFFEDTQGDLWVGTESGVYQRQGQRWVEIFPNLHVTTIVQDQAQNIWIGAREGLLRVAPSGEPVLFTSTNSGLVDNWVRDLLVDREGNLWVSTFRQERAPRPFPWGGVVTAIFFGFLFFITRNGYERSPETRGRRLGDQILQEPARLLPSIYALASADAEDPQVLDQLGAYLESNQDAAGARISRSFAGLISNPRERSLHAMAESLQADTTRVDAEPLSRLYAITAEMSMVKSAAEIADSDLTVLPSGQTTTVMIHFPKALEAPIPSFLGNRHAGAWRALAEVVGVLKKYRQVDDAADRLSYLAQALESLESAHEITREIPLPDGLVLQSIVEGWRGLVREEIDHISGRADLRLELLTRQVRKDDQVSVAFRLHNSGRAAAENLRITLEPDGGYSVSGNREVTIDRVPSGHSETIEFSVIPAAVEHIRVVCNLSWDDRVGAGHKFEFADVVSFYQTRRGFQRIPNPYIVGHPLKTSELFQGREDVFTFIKENLGGTVSDRTIILYGQRRTGKTSVLYQLLAGRLGEGFIPVLIDMQEIAALVQNSGDLLGEIAYQIVRAVTRTGVDLQGPQESALRENPVRAFNRFIDHLEEVLAGQRLVLMFDEFELIEQKIAERRIEVNLLDYFRSLMQHREHLVFIFTGTHRLEEMSHEYWSILFNIALYRKISFLQPEEARNLIREPVAGKLDIDDLAVEKILSLTSEQPYFTQLVCWALVDHCNNQQRNYATINDINDVIEQILATGKAHFAYIWHQADAGERLSLAGVAHTIKPGKNWARPDEVLELLEGHGVQINRPSLIKHLDRLAAQEVLEQASEGNLRYRFQIELLRLWIQKTQSIAALVERGI